MDYAYEMGDEAFFLGLYEPMKITRKPSDYLKELTYMDFMSYHSPAVRCAIDTIGADRIVFGSDAPMLVSIQAKRSRPGHFAIAGCRTRADHVGHGQEVAQTLRRAGYWPR